MGPSSILEGRASLPEGTVVGHTTWALSGRSSSNELDAQDVWPHQIPKRPNLQEEDMLVASWTCCIANSLGSGKKEVCGSSAGKASLEQRSGFQGFTRTARAARNRKMVVNGMANCFTLLRRITKLKCVNSEVTSVHILPKQGCPRLAPWHHAGVTMEITLDKNGSCHWSVGNRIPSHAIGLELYIYIYIYIWDHSPAGTFHGSRGGVFVGHRPPRNPGDPLH